MVGKMAWSSLSTYKYRKFHKQKTSVALPKLEWYKVQTQNKKQNSKDILYISMSMLL